jgi:Leucine-rich repeat (LRR) protein
VTTLLLNQNSIERIEGLASLVRNMQTQVSTLDLSHNKIAQLEGLESQMELEELWVRSRQLSSNRVELFENLNYLSTLPSLKTVVLMQVYLEGCPVAKYPGYRMKVKEVSPNITQIDAVQVA